MLNQILEDSFKEERAKKELLDETSVLIHQLPSDLVQEHVWPHIRERSTNFPGYPYDLVLSRMKDIIRLGSCSKKWNHLVRHTRFWAALKLVTKNISDINEDLATIEGAELLGFNHVASVFSDFVGGIPEISGLGGVEVHDLSRVKTYWKDLNDVEKENLLVKFS